ncbi:hypothetical protein [Streptomyces sp. NPDC057460]|uniref:hypothetical protein n=1 Tax=Streptomyces sp. NPDC057460 TaxID=3346141 RepID=UPI0036AD6C2B
MRTESGAVVPVTAARLTGGLLRQWQDRNRESTIPHTIEQECSEVLSDALPSDASGLEKWMAPRDNSPWMMTN